MVKQQFSEQLCTWEHKIIHALVFLCYGIFPAYTICLFPPPLHTCSFKNDVVFLLLHACKQLYMCYWLCRLIISSITLYFLLYIPVCCVVRVVYLCSMPFNVMYIDTHKYLCLSMYITICNNAFPFIFFKNRTV